MSEANPRGATAALAGRIYHIPGVGKVELTEGVLCAVDILTADLPDNAETKYATIFTAALTALGSPDINAETLAEKLAAKPDELKRNLFLDFRTRTKGNKILAARAAETATEAIKDYKGSLCVYRRNSVTNNQPKTIPGAGFRASLALFAADKLGLNWLQYIKVPATRIMALYAAECDRNGLWGLDTFATRHIFATQLDGAKKAQAELDKQEGRLNKKQNE